MRADHRIAAAFAAFAPGLVVIGINAPTMWRGRAFLVAGLPDVARGAVWIAAGIASVALLAGLAAMVWIGWRDRAYRL